MYSLAFGTIASFSSTGRNVRVASFANGEVKLGVGFTSPAPLLTAPSPRPRLANAFHRRSWFAPPKRIMSAASMALRDWTMLTGLNVISGNESNISWAQRRLPGQDVTGVAPFAQDFCSAGVPAPYRAINADLMSKLVALQTSPDACTCSPTKS